ncbi:ABC transporter substrate-binding protein [Nonomuraea sp. NPDC050404]|uniref:ABC transporter substrate-binding protein n=1 Tax=Nonomuraea sp. NPDC050404 TaxID=3155783 RepID=UPI0033C8CB08
MRLRTILAAAVLAVMTAACTATPAPPPQPAPEKQTIRVGVLPTADVAPLFIALTKGYFAQEGLAVEPVTGTGAGAMVPQVEAEVLDLAQTDYVASIVAGAAGKELKIVGALAQAGIASYGIVVAADSKIKSVRDLKRKKVAVNNLKGSATLGVTALLKDAGLSDKNVTFVEKPFPVMAHSLDDGEADAAWVAEPFLTEGIRKGVLRALPGTASGPYADLPSGGWMATDEWRTKNPATLAAFQRALAKGQRAASDRKEVEAVLPKYTKIEAETAASVSLGSYPTALDPRRLQQVADLVLRLGYVDEPADVKGLIATS